VGRFLLRTLDRLEEILIASLMAAATVLIFVAVVHRYGTGVPFLYPYFIQLHISWAQELCIYMFVWMAKFGAAYGVRTGIHVGVDVLVNQLSPARRKPVILFALLCGVLFTSVIGTMGLKFVMELYETGQVTADLEAPRWIVFSAIPAGSYLMCFRFLQVAWSFWKTGELPHHDESRVEGVEIDETPDAQPPSPAGAAR
jgi:C4-dicarboxylate transporter DctQ subunit